VRVKRPTSFDIAELAGVSQSTVSRALSGAGVVSEETRRKVAEAARRLNYKIDANARNLRLQSAKTIALLLYEDPVTSGSLINPFFLSMLSSTIKAAGRRGYDLVISFQEESADNADYVGSHRADGIIFFGYGDYVRYVDRVARLDEARIPSVTWGPVGAGQVGHFVGSDNFTGAREAVAHLIARGRKRIAFLGHHSEHTPELRERYRGYEQALGAAGLDLIPGLQRAADLTEEAGQAGIQEMLEGGVPFDAVFAACDLIAIGAMKGLRQYGKSIPGDVAVMGFDDIVTATFTDPPLTTVRQNTEAAGELMVETLLALIDGEEVSSRMIPTRLMVRGSCG
jgi:DNA-binding LacI/PurR family transcriptional regulator